MANPSCPKCGAEISKIWVNKKQQRNGKCGACGKTVYLGRSNSDGSPAADTGKGKEVKPAKEEKKIVETVRRKKAGKQPASAASHGGRADGGKPKPVAERSLLDRFSDWLDS